MNNSASDSYDKIDMQEKVSALVSLHEAIQEKLKTVSFQNESKFLPWYLINCLKCSVQNTLISMKTLFEAYMKSKK